MAACEQRTLANYIYNMRWQQSSISGLFHFTLLVYELLSRINEKRLCRAETFWARHVEWERIKLVRNVCDGGWSCQQYTCVTVDGRDDETNEVKRGMSFDLIQFFRFVSSRNRGASTPVAPAAGYKANSLVSSSSTPAALTFRFSLRTMLLARHKKRTSASKFANWWRSSAALQHTFTRGENFHTFPPGSRTQELRRFHYKHFDDDACDNFICYFASNSYGISSSSWCNSWGRT